MPTYIVEDLIEEIRVAVDIIENHHVNCNWIAEPDLEAEESESCAEFAELYGKGYDRLVCHDHDKLREWTKMLWNHNSGNENYISICSKCMNDYTNTHGDSATYTLCPDCVATIATI